MWSSNQNKVLQQIANEASAAVLWSSLKDQLDERLRCVLPCKETLFRVRLDPSV